MYNLIYDLNMICCMNYSAIHTADPLALRPSWNPLSLDLASFSSSETIHTTRVCGFNSAHIQKKKKSCWAKDNKAVPSGECGQARSN